MARAMFRWLVLAVIAAMVGIASWHARGIRRTAPKMRVPLTRVLAVAPLFAGIVAYLANPNWMEWSSLSLPAWARWTGVALAVLALPSMHWVMASFGKTEDGTTTARHRLITSGPYRWMRHPMYVVDMMFCLSIGLMAANGFILMWAAVLLVAVRFFVVPREEARLIELFGDEYRRYQSRTGSFLPCAFSKE